MSSIFKDTSYNISFEPGRYLVANAGVVITKILTTKTSESVNFLITDAGMQTLLRPAIYNATHKIIALTNNSNDKIEYTVAGPICESSDKFLTEKKFQKIKEGDYVSLANVGAYGMSLSSNYNTRPFIAEIMVSGSKHKLIRKRQSLARLINN